MRVFHRHLLAAAAGKALNMNRLGDGYLQHQIRAADINSYALRLGAQAR